MNLEQHHGPITLREACQTRSPKGRVGHIGTVMGHTQQLIVHITTN